MFLHEGGGVNEMGAAQLRARRARARLGGDGAVLPPAARVELLATQCALSSTE